MERFGFRFGIGSFGSLRLSLGYSLSLIFCSPHHIIQHLREVLYLAFHDEGLLLLGAGVRVLDDAAVGLLDPGFRAVSRSLLLPSPRRARARRAEHGSSKEL